MAQGTYEALDLTFTHRGLRTRIIERPGLTLPREGVGALLAQAREVAASLGGSPLDYGPLSGRKEWLDRAVVTVVEDVATSRAVGAARQAGLARTF